MWDGLGEDWGAQGKVWGDLGGGPGGWQGGVLRVGGYGSAQEAQGNKRKCLLSSFTECYTIYLDLPRSTFGGCP